MEKLNSNIKGRAGNATGLSGKEMGRPNWLWRAGGRPDNGARWSVGNKNPEPVFHRGRGIRDGSDGAGLVLITELGFGETGGVGAHLGGRRTVWMPAELGEGRRGTGGRRGSYWHRRQLLGWPQSSARSGSCGGGFRLDSGEAGCNGDDGLV